MDKAWNRTERYSFLEFPRGTLTEILFSLFRQVASSNSLAQHFLTEVAIDKTLEMLGNLSGNLDNGACHQVSDKGLSVKSPHAKLLLCNNKAKRGFMIHNSPSWLLLAPTSGLSCPRAHWNKRVSPFLHNSGSLQDGLKHCPVQVVPFFTFSYTNSVHLTSVSSNLDQSTAPKRLPLFRA